MITQPQKSDFLGDVGIAIVGGGPAACSTALHIERLDPDLAGRTIILERRSHPREKVCGGALTINAERILAELNVDLDIHSAPVSHVELAYGNLRFSLPDDGCAKRIIRRCELDSALFNATKARSVKTWENIRVTRVTRMPNYLRVCTDLGHFHAQAVVSADGMNAILRRTPGFGRGKITRVFAIETPADDARERVFTERVMIVDLSYIREGLKGYYWDFPCYIDGRPYVSRGIVAASRFGNRRYLDDVLARRGVDLTGALRRAWPIRHFDPNESYSQPRMLLVGDALGSDPLFSEGISQALASGKLAAEALVAAFRRNDLSFSRYTQDVRSSRVGAELRAYALASRLLYGAGSHCLISLLSRNKELRDLIGHSYGGTANLHQRLPALVAMVGKHLLRYPWLASTFRAQVGDLTKPRSLLQPAAATGVGARG